MATITRQGMWTILYLVAIENQGKNEGRILINHLGEKVDNSKEFPVSLLEWEFVLRRHILFFMKSSCDNINSLQELQSEAEKTKPTYGE